LLLVCNVQVTAKMGHVGDAPSTLPTIGYALPDAQAEGWPEEGWPERENDWEAPLAFDEGFQAIGKPRWKMCPTVGNPG
jgi:hypothetical protein